MEELKRRLGGWQGPFLAAVIAVLSSGLGGLIVNYGANRELSADVRNLCSSVTEIKTTMARVAEVAATNTLSNAIQTEQINTLRESVRDLRELAGLPRIKRKASEAQ